MISYTVSQLNKKVRSILEKEIDKVWVIGEISSFSNPISGHWYFILKDEYAQIRCTMFRKNNLSTTFKPHSGQKVLLKASISLYEPRGNYQLMIECMQLTGSGLFKEKLELLKKKLCKEGLFEQQKKRNLPNPIHRVGIITSINGAVLYDILHILKRRDPSLPVIIYPTSVQGQEAPIKIIQAIEIANHRSECDVLIVGRGGGDQEDLISFNNEDVARAIYSSNLPIISAIGHETDVTISDLVSDLRAPTPSAAAELVSNNKLDLLRYIKIQRDRLDREIEFFLKKNSNILGNLQYRLKQKNPNIFLLKNKNEIIKLRHRIESSLKNNLYLLFSKYDDLNKRLLKKTPIIYLHNMQHKLNIYFLKLQKNTSFQMYLKKNIFIQLCSRLKGVSPLNTIDRGFSITTNKEGMSLKYIYQINIGDKLITRLKDGWVESKVIKLTTDLEFKNS